MGEFDLIRRYFQHALRPTGVALGNGDDCALLAPAAGQQLAVSTDMLVEGRHFFSDVCPEALGHKALAVNLSDLAAMGAEPLAFTLALSLPKVDETWLQGFSHGLLSLADAHGCALIGGDTTAGPLNLCITVMGQVPLAQALRRSAAQAGDDIYVSGQVGDARLALEVLNGRIQLDGPAFAAARQRLERPTPRVALGQALRGVAHAAVDVSDGLLGDLGHLLSASGLGADLHTHWLQPEGGISPTLAAQTPQWVQTCALAGGDDYELVFTAPPSARLGVEQAARRSQTRVTRIGHTSLQRGLRVRDERDQHLSTLPGSFDHFV